MVIQAYDTRENISKAFKTKIVDYNADNYMDSTGLMYLSTCPIPEWIAFELLEKSTRLFRNEKYQLFRGDGLTLERFKTIAQSIGEKSTRTDFISSLTYQLDVDDTINEYVLCEVAQVLGDFVPYIGGIKYANYLFAPLVILCNIADHNVRGKAVQSLCKIGEQINTSTLIHDFTLHILQLVDGNLFRAQASALGLYHIIYSTAPEDVKTTLRMHYIKLCRHTHPLVRKSAATNIGKFAAVVEPFYRKTDIMTMFKALTQDDLDFVRLYSIVSCAPLMESFEPQVYAAHILPVISKLSQDAFWRVRYTIADQFLEFCKSATLDATRVELISIFVRLVRDEHREVRLAAMRKVSALCGIWTTELVMQDILFRCVKGLSSDSALDVRVALISEILSMASVFGKDVAIEKLLPFIRSLLADESSFVQLNVISKIDQVAKVVGIDQLSHQLVDVTDKLVNDTDWLVRYEVTKNYIPLLASHLSGVTSTVDKLTDLCKQRMEDEKRCVCVAANESFKRLAEMDLVIPRDCCLN